MIAMAAFSTPALVPYGPARGIHAILSPRDGDKLSADVLGWSAFGRFLDSADTSFGIHTPTVLIAPSYAQAALAVFHSERASHAYSLDEGISRYGQQFAIWGSLENLAVGSNAVIVRTGHEAEASFESELRKMFNRVEHIDLSGEGVDRRLRFFGV